MFISFKLFFISFCIGLTAVCGDSVESKLTTPWAVALVDNLTHALIGCLSWLSVSLGKSTNVRNDKVMFREVVFCGLIASVIDLDHFLSASSWKLADATHLKTRPFLHNTSLVLGIFVFLLLTGHFLLSSVWSIAWIFVAAGISHHIRDATRRGIWLWPFGSTPPIPYPLYVGLLAIFPFILRHLGDLCPGSPYDAIPVESLTV